MSGKLTNKTALVTGGSGGIGAAICELFVSEGAKVMIADIANEAGHHLADRLGPMAEFVPLDVTQPAAWTDISDRFDNDDAPLHCLINNAGISGLRNIEDADFEWWQRFLSVNADSVFLGIHTLLPALRRGEVSSIVNIGSTLALKANGELPAYCASKAAVRHLTKSVALYCAHRGDNIRCNAVHPGSTMTDMMKKNLGTDEQAQKAAMSARFAVHPFSKALGRIAAPQDIARAVLFLASDDSAFITGVDLPVDGGATL